MDRTVPTASATTPAGQRELRRVLVSAGLGQFVEWYDFVIYAYSAATIAVLFFPGSDPTAALLSTLAVYAVGFATRPLGGILWGVLGDRIGRRTTLSVIILLMGAATVGIGLLPTYSQVGLLAPALLVLCRLVQGLSAAGESLGASSFVAEHAPPNRRGLLVAVIYACAFVPSIAAALLVLLISNSLDPADHAAWGWRLPFLLAGPLALIGLYIRHRTDESPAFQAMRAAKRVAKTPLRIALRHYQAPMANAFAIAALSALAFYTMSGYFVTYLTTTAGLSQNSALISNSIALIVVFCSMCLGGALSDRHGRRNVMLLGVAGTVVLALPAYALASAGSLLSAIAGQSLLALPLGFFFGPSGSAILEFFPTRVRLSGALLSYNVAYAIFGGSAQLLSTWLVLSTGNQIAPAYYLLMLAAAVALVLWRLPETSKQNLVHAEDER